MITSNNISGPLFGLVSHRSKMKLFSIVDAFHPVVGALRAVRVEAGEEGALRFAHRQLSSPANRVPAERVGGSVRGGNDPLPETGTGRSLSRARSRVLDSTFEAEGSLNVFFELLMLVGADGLSAEDRADKHDSKLKGGSDLEGRLVGILALNRAVGVGCADVISIRLCFTRCDTLPVADSVASFLALDGDGGYPVLPRGNTLHHFALVLSVLTLEFFFHLQDSAVIVKLNVIASRNRDRVYSVLGHSRFLHISVIVDASVGVVWIPIETSRVTMTVIMMEKSDSSDFLRVVWSKNN